MYRYEIILCIATFLLANTREPDGGRIWDIKVHNINNVEMCVSNYGKIGQDASGEPGCWWPTGSDCSYLYGAGIWFGVRDQAGGGIYDTLVSIGYGPHGGESEFCPGLTGQDPYPEYVMIYMYPDPWPAPVDTFPMAPQDVVSDQDSWCCFNDSNPDYHIPGDTRPIGIEIFQTVYAWDIPPLEDVIFLMWEVHNTSGGDLQECYIGLCADIDIGNEAGTGADYLNGCIVGQWYVVDGESIWVDNCAYEWLYDDEPGWPTYSGVMCCDFLQTPPDLIPGEDKDNDGIPDQYERDSAYYWDQVPQNLWDVDGDGVPDWRDPSQWPHMGMTAYKYYTINLEPNHDNQRYLALAGYNYATGQYEPYDTVPPQPDDHRIVLGCGPFDIEQDSSATMIFAIMFAEWLDIYGAPDTALVWVNRDAEDWYEMNWYLYTEVEEYSHQSISPSLSIVPNPVTDRVNLQFKLMQPGHVSFSLYDAAGRLVKHTIEEDRSAGPQRATIDTYGLSSGIYFAVLKTGTQSTTRSFVIFR